MLILQSSAVQARYLAGIPIVRAEDNDAEGATKNTYLHSEPTNFLHEHKIQSLYPLESPRETSHTEYFF